MFINIEIKARCADPGFVRKYLQSQGADFIGVDEQSDTYFQTRNGRLKLREGNIENNLIFYQRDDQSGPKASHFQLIKMEEATKLKEVLEVTNGIRVIVRKIREIYYIGNVKFHIDTIPGLGNFIEIEAGNKTDLSLGEKELREQCERYVSDLGIRKDDLVDRSYSDLLSDDHGT
jgi:adenylate cyclase class 2